VDNTLAVSVVDGFASLHKQLEPVFDPQLVPITVLNYGRTIDILHHKVWTAILGGSGIKDPCDIRMIEHGQSLSLDLKTRQEFPVGSQTRPDNLECHLPPYRLLLLGQVYNTVAPDAQRPEQPVVADELAVLLDDALG
jgi:hypothetical protein